MDINKLLEIEDDDAFFSAIDDADGYHSVSNGARMLAALAALEPHIASVAHAYSNEPLGQRLVSGFRSVMDDMRKWAENPSSETREQMHRHCSRISEEESRLRHLGYSATVGDHARYQVVARLERYLYLRF